MQGVHNCWQTWHGSCWQELEPPQCLWTTWWTLLVARTAKHWRVAQWWWQTTNCWSKTHWGTQDPTLHAAKTSTQLLFSFLRSRGITHIHTQVNRKKLKKWKTKKYRRRKQKLTATPNLSSSKPTNQVSSWEQLLSIRVVLPRKSDSFYSWFLCKYWTLSASRSLLLNANSTPNIAVWLEQWARSNSWELLHMLYNKWYNMDIQVVLMDISQIPKP